MENVRARSVESSKDGATPLPCLISFDIDGTLDVGDPPGQVTMEMVRRAKDMGYLVGSCSDRPINAQQQLWDTHRIAVDFTVLKHRLSELKGRFEAIAYYHIGDTELDRHLAKQAGFTFVMANAVTGEPWAGPLG